jgi:hypothetical protein
MTLTILLGLASGTAWAQDEASPGARHPNNEVRFYLMDQSVIAGTLQLTDLLVETKFGSLTVPIDSLQSFTPGLGSHPQLRRRLGELVEELGSEDFGVREAAQNELRRLGQMARSHLQARADDPDPERKRRVEQLLEELESFADFNDEMSDDPSLIDGPLVERDTVVTDEFTIVGKIVPQSFEITSRYGPLTVKLSDIRRAIRPGDEPVDSQKKLVVTGANLIQNGYRDSGLIVRRGDRISVVAEGAIMMTPWGQQAVSGPDGGPNYGWHTPGQIASGCLVAQIGDSGPVLKVGSRADFVAEQTGKLSFAVAMQPNFAGNQFPGEYKLKIRVVRSGEAEAATPSP